MPGFLLFSVIVSKAFFLLMILRRRLEEAPAPASVLAVCADAVRLVGVVAFVISPFLLGGGRMFLRSEPMLAAEEMTTSSSL
jgi:hypothetical protein